MVEILNGPAHLNFFFFQIIRATRNSTNILEAPCTFCGSYAPKSHAIAQAGAYISIPHICPIYYYIYIYKLYGCIHDSLR